jgi:hypothetical protein
MLYRSNLSPGLGRMSSPVVLGIGNYPDPVQMTLRNLELRAQERARSSSFEGTEEIRDEADNRQGVWHA